MDYAPGIMALQEELSLSIQQLADRCGVSRRTAEEWEHGRMIDTTSLNVMSGLLEKHR